MIDIENVRTLAFILKMMPHDGLMAVELDSPAYRDMLSDEGQKVGDSLDRNVRLALTLPVATLLSEMVEANL